MSEDRKQVNEADLDWLRERDQPLNDALAESVSGEPPQPAGDDLLRAAELERAAKALWKIGNARIGYREWATVRDHYLNEAQACVATYMGIRCHAGMDGDCNWPGCPQKRDGEPHKSNRHCPYDWQDEED